MVTRRSLQLLLALICSCCLHASGLPLSNFFSFGPSAGDSEIQRTNGASSPAVSLPQPFRLYGTNYSTAYINANGVITFQGPASSSQEDYPNEVASVAAFWTPIDDEGESAIASDGGIYYRVTNDSSLTLDFTNRVSRSFRGSSQEFIGFTASQLLIVTWDRVEFVAGMNETNTFQCVLATNYLHSYVFFLYADGMMQWSGEPYALIGFNAGDGVTHYTLPTSQSEAVLDITGTSNSAAGVWLFRTDASNIIQPGAVIGLDQSSYEVSEADANVHVCVILYDGILAQAVEVTVSSRQGGSAGVTDFTAASHTVTFANSDVTGESTRQTCIDFPVLDDDILEIDETFEIHIDMQQSGDSVPVTILPHTTIVTIMDDDPVIVEPLSTPQNMSEGSNNQICVNVIGSRGIPITFFYTLSPDTAQDGVDYVNSTAEISVPARITRPCFPVGIINDNVYRTGRRFYYNIGSRDPHVTFRGRSGVAEIHDNDESSVRIGFDSESYVVMEGDSFDVCVWNTGVRVGQPFTIRVRTALSSSIFYLDAAERNVDFGDKDQQITFLPSEPLRTQKCFTVQTYNDSVYEGEEQYGVHMSFDYKFTEVNSPARIYIRDNDVIWVSLSQSVYNAREQSYLTVCANLTGNIENNLPFNFNVERGTAEVSGEQSDINPLTIQSPAITFTSSSHMACSTIFVLGDSTLEERIETFNISLVSAARRDDPDHIRLVNASAQVLVEDIDVVRISFPDGPQTVNEDSLSVTPCVLVEGHSSIRIPVQLRYGGGSATDGADYNLIGGNVSFTANREAQSDIDCNGLVVQIYDDPVVENRENIIIRLHSDEPQRIKITSIAAQQITSINVIDNDVVHVSFAEQLLYISEGAGGVDVCLKMRGFTEISLSASIATSAQTAQADIDFEPQSVQLTFPPTNQSVLDDLYLLPVAERLSAPLHVSSPVCSRVNIIDDDILEETSTKLLRLTLTERSSEVRFESPSTVYVTIIDDDAVTLEVQDTEVEVSEGEGMARVCATMQGRADFPIRAVFTTAAGTATSADDYTDTPVEVVFPALDNSPRCADIPITDDSVLEFVETFSVHLAISSPHHSKVNVGNSTVVTVTIIDDDFVNIGLERSDYTAGESDGQVSVCAELNGALSRPISVSLSTPIGSGTAQADIDYTPVTNVTLFAGLSLLDYRRECVDITILPDSVLENTESFEVALSSPSEDVHFTRDTANVYVLDDDGVRMGLMTRDYADYEGEEIEICVELVGMISQDINFNVHTEAGTAQADIDYNSFSLPLVFHPLSVNNQEICHNLTLLEDDIYEDEESLSVVMDINHPRVSIHIDRAAVSIMDNDELTLSFLVGEMSISEDMGEMEACVELQGSTAEEIMYTVRAQPGTAQDSVDYIFFPSVATFSFTPSMESSQRLCHSVSLVDDELLESTEQFSLHLSSNVSRVNVITDLIQVTVMDDDIVTVGFNQTEYLIVEEVIGGASITACAVLTGRIEEDVVVTMSTKSNSAGANDYTALDNKLTFVPSAESEQTICRMVAIHDDRDVEGPELFRIQLTSDDSRILLQPSVAAVTITDSDVVCDPEELLSSRGMYSWPQTYPSETAELRCTLGGVVTRFCTSAGHWEKPDVSKCLVSAEKLFKYLMLNSFTDDNFSELLYAVQLVESEGKGARPEYMDVVSSYFSQLTNKVENEEQFTFTSELLEMTLNIVDGVQQWQQSVLQPYSSSFVSQIEQLFEIFIQTSNITLFEYGMKHSALFLQKGDSKVVLPTDKPKTVQFSKETNTDNIVIAVDDSSDNGKFGNSITLPPSLQTLFANTSSNGKEEEEVAVFFTFYDTAVMFPIAEGNGARRNETNVSAIITATVLNQNVVDLKENITYTLLLDTPPKQVSGVICVSWDFEAVDGLGNWTDKGCTNLTDGSHGNVTCSCNHLTNFAVLVDIRPKPVGQAPVTVRSQFNLNIISIIGVAVSILGLLLTIITLLAFKKLRQRDSTVLRIQFCISVILMLISFVAGIERVQLFEVCVTISALIHYFTLVSLMWMAAEALLMFQKAIISTNVNYKYFIIVSLICWLLPIPAVVIPIGLNRDYVTHEEFCFISHNIVFYAAFLGPIAGILIFNLLIFLVVVCVVIRHSANRYKNTQKHSKRKGIMLTMLNIIAVLVLFGITWTFGALMVERRQEIFEFMFVVSNSLQGFYVFIFFVVLAKETRELWLETCGCRKKKEEPDVGHMPSIPGTPTVTRVPSLRRAKPFNIDDYGKRLEELTIDTPDTRKRMNSWDIMYVMPQNQFHVLLFSDNQLQQHSEQEQEDDFDKEVELPSSTMQESSKEGEEGGLEQDNRSTADSGIMDDKGKNTPSPTMGRSHYVEMSIHQPGGGGTPVHTHSVSGIGYVSDESTEDSASHDLTAARTPITFKQTQSHDIELDGKVSRHSNDVIETSKV